MDKWHINFALQQMVYSYCKLTQMFYDRDRVSQGVAVSEKQIIMSKEIVNGPNLRLQNQLFRFYVIVNRLTLLGVRK